jgi:hypothetical protein
MAKRKPSSKPGKRAARTDLPASTARSARVKGGALLLGTQQLQASRQWTEGNGQPQHDLRTR